MITTKQRLEFPPLKSTTSADSAKRLGEKLQTGALRATDALSESIFRHPVIAIGGALTLGVVLGWLIKRR